jgi:hypothetical protein
VLQKNNLRQYEPAHVWRVIMTDGRHFLVRDAHGFLLAYVYAMSRLCRDNTILWGVEPHCVKFLQSTAALFALSSCPSLPARQRKGLRGSSTFLLVRFIEAPFPCVLRNEAFLSGWLMTALTLVDHPAHWQQRAGEMRQLAKDMPDPDTKRTMLNIAAGYHTIVQWGRVTRGRAENPSETFRECANSSEPDGARCNAALDC